jgi:cupin fold WbuC family metalloprotein
MDPMSLQVQFLSDFQLLDQTLFQEGIERAKNSPRKRTNHNFHAQEEHYQRFLNVLTKGTYVTPHRHKVVPKPETFIIIKGKVGFMTWDESGNLLSKSILSGDGPIHGIDLQPGVWHNIVCLSEQAICFEGKLGPYDPSIDKEFATWAPMEGDVSCEEYLKQWENYFI